ncbi:polymorphic toxin-type HINT domain-containing protein, partial [Ruminococcus sp.]|uniref:polymorphic toxin-type HINT domain-containing protein n=1 Tax=Ruminococcus sp. TaxID=41978 RepID=UPI0025D00ED3
GLLAIGAAKGLLAGAVIGGIIGGISAKATGKGSFFEGFEDGAFSGAITGAIFGGIGGAGELAGQALGRSCDLIAKFGPAIKNVTLSANILNLGMAGFDLVSLGAMMIDPKCKLVQLNQMMHSSKLYNGVQLGLGAVGAFGAGMLKGIQFDLQNGISKCFVAGTMISTVSGLTAIENIRAGDIVLSADEKTGERGFKKVVETYVRETMKLVHLIVNGEEIVTTEGHPFYVKELGFVKAAELSEGDILTDSKGGEMPIEFIKTETTDSPVTVYNFQVEEYHTYFVSDTGILVHNADSSYISPSEQAKSWQGKGKYPGVDEYVDVTVNKGTVLYRGEPNGSEYFTTIDAIEKSGRNATKIFEGLQVEKHPIYGYRSEMKGYIFNQDIEAAYGITNANPQFGAGGLPQYFVPDVQTLIDNNILVPIDNISLTP